MNPDSDDPSPTRQGRFAAERADFLVTGGLLVLTLAVFARVLTAPGYLAYHGDILQYYGTETVIRHGLSQEGELPLWNPYFEGGRPEIGNPVANYFYPPMMFMRLLNIPLVATFNSLAILHIWLAGVGIYLLLRNLGANRSAATLSACSYMLSGATLPRLVAGHTIILYATTWPAWILLGYRRLLLRPSWWAFLATAVLVSLEALTGHPQIALIYLLVPVSFFVYHTLNLLRARKWQLLLASLGLSAVVVLVAGALVSGQYLPSLDLFRRSGRAAPMTYERSAGHSLGFWNMGLFVLPLLWYDPATATNLGFGNYWEMSPYVGILALFLSVMAVFMRHEPVRRSLIRYLIILAVLSLVLAMGSNTPLYYPVYYLMPVMRAPGRFAYLVIFALTILSGLGLDTMLTHFQAAGSAESPWPIRIALALTAFAGLVLIGCLIWGAWGHDITAAVQRSGRFTWVETGVFAARQQINLIGLLVALLIGAWLAWIVAKRWTTTQTLGWVFVAGILAELLIPAYQQVLPYSRLAYDPQSPLAKLDVDPSEVRLVGLGRAATAYLIPTVDRIDPFTSSALLAIKQYDTTRGRGAQLMASGYFITTEPVSEPDVEEIQHADGAYLYRYTDMWPRLYAAPAIELVRDDSAALALVTAPAFDPSRLAVVTTESGGPDLPVSPQAPASVTARYTSYGMNRLSAYVEADRPVMVVFSEMYHPGWEATVDGQPAPIWKANYTFRGVVVGPGEHVIDMRYRPASSRWGLAISLVTLGCMVLISAVVYVRHIK